MQDAAAVQVQQGGGQVSPKPQHCEQGARVLGAQAGPVSCIPTGPAAASAQLPADAHPPCSPVRPAALEE